VKLTDPVVSVVQSVLSEQVPVVPALGPDSTWNVTVIPTSGASEVSLAAAAVTGWGVFTGFSAVSWVRTRVAPAGAARMAAPRARAGKESSPKALDLEIMVGTPLLKRARMQPRRDKAVHGVVDFRIATIIRRTET
jgi:hypothetical protein